MSKKTFNLILGTCALIIGGWLYIKFRENSYITIAYRRFIKFSLSKNTVKSLDCPFIQFYLQDFLWAFSLGCLLNTVTETSKITSVLCAVISFLCGFTWEILQALQIVSGTFDLIDILMYFSAGVICFLINFKER